MSHHFFTMARKKTNVRESLRASFKDGMCAAFMGGVNDYYATPLALFLGATVQQVRGNRHGRKCYRIGLLIELLSTNFLRCGVLYSFFSGRHGSLRVDLFHQ